MGGQVYTPYTLYEVFLRASFKMLRHHSQEEDTYGLWNSVRPTHVLIPRLWY